MTLKGTINYNNNFSSSNNEHKLIKDYPIVEVNINKIRKDPSNPNEMEPEQVKGLTKSLIDYGRLQYVVIDQNNILIDGEHRVKIEKELGTTTIKAIQIPISDEIDRKLIRETLNKLRGKYNPKKESDELLTLLNNNRLSDLSQLLGQPTKGFIDLIEEHHSDLNLDYSESTNFLKRKDSLYQEQDIKSEQELIKNTKKVVSTGEIWQLGRHYLKCGNSTSKEDIQSLLQVLGQINDSDRLFFKPALMFTDPPYNVGFKYHKHHDTNSESDYVDFCRAWFTLALNYVSPELLVFTPGPKNITIYDNIKKMDDIGIWYKNNSRSGASMFYFRRCEPILFYGKINTDKFDSKRTDDYFNYSMQTFDELKPIEAELNITEQHAPAKTLDFVMDIVNNYSLPNDIVMDMFLGTGTTIMALEITNRKCIGLEYDETYCSAILERFYRVTGIDPVRLSDTKSYTELKQELYPFNNLS